MQDSHGLRRIEVVIESLDHGRRRLAGRSVGCDRVPIVERLRALLRTLQGPVERRAIMRLQHAQTQHLARPIGQHLTDREEVAERLRHLLALELQEAVVHPDICHAVGVKGAAGLREFVLMVRKHQVDTATMNVELLAEVLPGHCRAFDVPAGTAFRLDAGRRRPRRLAWLRRLPQHEVGVVALVWGDIDAGAGDHLVERAFRQGAIARHHGIRSVHRLR